VKGPLGELSREVHPLVKVAVEEEGVKVDPTEESIQGRALWGTFASHIRNMIHGVNEPYKKTLILEGVGYRMAVEGSDVVLNVGYSHQVRLKIPEGVKVEVQKNEMTISGIDKEMVGQFAANVRAKKKPEPYKGKGLRYSDETIIRKQGKKAA
jgi:large subunit ribosomal protein L6